MLGAVLGGASCTPSTSRRSSATARACEGLIQHLRAWEPAVEKWLAPQGGLLRPLIVRYLGHRFGMPFVNQGGKLREAADTVVFLCRATFSRRWSF